MSLKARAALAILVLVAAGYWWWKYEETPAPWRPIERQSTIALIDQLEARVAGNSEDAESFTLLGKLYLQYARETGDLEGYVLAEKRLRKALLALPSAPRVQGTLAEVLLGQNRWAEARSLAQEAFEKDRGDLRALTVVGDAETELGHHDDAEKAFEALRAVKPVPAILARLGQVAELRGDLDRARGLMEEALVRAEKEAREPADAAWFLTRLCLLYIHRGELEKSRALCEKALALREDQSTLTGLANVRTAEARYDEAIRLYEAVASRRPDPIVHAALADLYMIAGKADSAKQHAERAVAIAESAPIPAIHRRFLSSLYARREGGAEHALELAKEDLAERPDPRSWDTLAFALLANGRPDEAAAASAKAMALDPPDAKLHYHAALIQHALGNRPAARRHLERSLALHPHFSVRDAPAARALLAELAGSETPGDFSRSTR